MAAAILLDHITKRPYRVRRARCACCGRKADEARLFLDHTFLSRGYLLTVLCHSCNSKKQAQFGWHVSLGDNWCWYPGMPIGARAPKPKRSLAMTVRGLYFAVERSGS